MQTANDYNEKFGLRGTLSFKSGKGGLIYAEIENEHASALICLYGAHVMNYIPRGQKPVLWVSGASNFSKGKPIRGGIPVCWPWFGAHSDVKSFPSHGFARIADWKLEETFVSSDGATQMLFTLSDNECSRQMWQYPFLLQLQVSVGKKLSVELTTFNKGSKSFSYTAALHTYFNISAIENVIVNGLADCSYVDTLDNTTHKQEGGIRIVSETDRIYMNPSEETVIVDNGFKRCIKVLKKGCSSVVVWNPWIAKSKRMEDFGDEEYKEMICVETASTSFDRIKIEPQTVHTIKTQISTEEL